MQHRYVEQYDEDLNTTLILVSRVFPFTPKLPQAALHRAILLTLNQSATPNVTATVPPAQKNSPAEIVAVTGLVHESLDLTTCRICRDAGQAAAHRYL